MSTKAINWAWEQPIQSAAQKLLLLALADKADERHSCFPGQKLLAEMTGAKERSVRSNLAMLEAGGFFRRERRHRENGSRTSDRFFLAVDGLPADSATGRSTSIPPADSDGLPADSGTTYRQPSAGDKNHQRNHQKEPPEEPFEIAWRVWPRKDGKKPARVKFEALTKGTDGRELAEKIWRYGKAWTDAGRDPQFCRYLVTWLNQEGWEDPLPEPERTRGSARQEQQLAMIARYEREEAQRAVEG